jgi:type VI secretion system protein
MFGGELPIQVDVAPDANENSPVAVDLILVYDPKVLDELLKLSAGAWFAQREQFLADHGGALQSELREWVPGQPVPPFILSYHPGARRVVLFADYDTQGDHRATIDPQQPFRLVLGEKDFSVEEPAGGRGGLD